MIFPRVSVYLSSGCYCWVGRKGTCTGMEMFSSVYWLFKESCSKSPDFPLKNILVRVFQNHKLRVKIKNMFSWCSERQDLAQIRTIFPHSSCQEHYLKIANWLALIFPFFLKWLCCVLKTCFSILRWRQARIARRATIQCQILVAQAFIVWGCHGYGSYGC